MFMRVSLGKLTECHGGGLAKPTIAAAGCETEGVVDGLERLRYATEGLAWWPLSISQHIAAKNAAR